MSITHEEIASRLNLARSTVTRILNNDPNYRASQKTRKKVLALARELSYDFGNLRRIHRRRFERIPVDFPVYVKILLPDDMVFDEGHAKMLDLSPVSALIGEFRLHKQVMPVTEFLLGIEVLEGELAAVRLRARIARISLTEGVQMGVEFVEIEREVLDRIKKFLNYG
ncbi:MAG: LacI family DNA-binding transcriptional regulator [Planctomycetes bacterium]|nr:LacI family DNA-binding transcriptional regulator [Planctomycetota bacterium]